MEQKLLVLDTHIWIWLLNGDAERLSKDGLEAIAQASQSAWSLCDLGLGGWHVD